MNIWLGCIFGLLLSGVVYGAVSIPDVVVSPTKYDSFIHTSGQDVRVITSDELSALGLTTFTEIASLVPGFSLVNSGGDPSLFVRGLPSNQTKVFLDGIDLSDVISPQRTPALSMLSIHNIDRIEILSGTQGSLYGSGTAGGVIHIFTKSNSDHVPNQLQVEFGDRIHRGSISTSHQFSNTHVYLSGATSLTDTHSWVLNSTESDQDKLSSLHFGIKHRVPFGTIQTTFIQSNRWLDIDNGFPISDDTDRTNNGDQTLSQVKVTVPVAQSELIMSYSSSRLRRGQRDPDPAVDTANYTSLLEQIEFMAKLPDFGGHAIVLGFDSQLETGQADSVLYQDFPKTSQSTQGLFVDWLYLQPIVSFRGGSRYQRYETIAQQRSIMTYHVGLFGEVPVLNILANVSLQTGYRSPSLYEQKAPFGGNPSLRAEESQTLELSLSKSLRQSQFEVTVYKNEISDLITYTTAYTNASLLTTSQGVEYSWSYFPGDLIQFIKLYYTHIDSNQPRVPVNKMSAVSHLSFPIVDVGLALHCMGRRKRDSVLNATSIDPYTTLDVTLTRALSDMDSIYLQVDNLTDVLTQDAVGYQNAGRIISIGYRRQF